MSRAPGTFVVGLALAMSCASQPPPRPVAVDPSNPSAPEAPPLETSNVLAPVPSPTPEAHPAQPDGAAAGLPAPMPEHHHGATAREAGGGDHQMEAPRAPASESPATVYTCPMHPEVISAEPGSCPKCGMKLVPKRATEGKQ